MLSFLLLAGGTGSRMKENTPKQFLLLAGKPVILHTMEKAEKIEKISEIVIVCVKGYKKYINNYIQIYNLQKKYTIVEGGSTRQESVFLGLKACSYNSIIVHEAARPFVTINDFKTLINDKAENITYGIDIPFTVLKRDKDLITETLDRNTLVNIQLPQKFNKNLLLNAHMMAKRNDLFFTEDASLLLNITGTKIKILKGKSYNIKLTDSVDIIVAEEIYKEYVVGE